MKNAMWATFIFVMGVIGIVVISLFGNITTTNQQDYTLLKNAVEASMLDSMDQASYRAGFYVCPKNKNQYNKKTKTYNFESSNDYEILLKTDENVKLVAMENSKYNNCYLVKNQFKINADVFSEVFLKRFSNNVNNSKSYTVKIQDIIEFPPKVSISVTSHNNYTNDSKTLDFSTEDFDINNKISSILEISSPVKPCETPVSFLSCNSKYCMQYDKNDKVTEDEDKVFKTVTTLENNEFVVTKTISKTSNAREFDVSYSAVKKNPYVCIPTCVTTYEQVETPNSANGVYVSIVLDHSASTNGIWKDIVDKAFEKIVVPLKTAFGSNVIIKITPFNGGTDNKGNTIDNYEVSDNLEADKKKLKDLIEHDRSLVAKGIRKGLSGIECHMIKKTCDYKKAKKFMIVFGDGDYGDAEDWVITDDINKVEEFKEHMTAARDNGVDTYYAMFKHNIMTKDEDGNLVYTKYAKYAHYITNKYDKIIKGNDVNDYATAFETIKNNIIASVGTTITTVPKKTCNECQPEPTSDFRDTILSDFTPNKDIYHTLKTDSIANVNNTKFKIQLNEFDPNEDTYHYTDTITLDSIESVDDAEVYYGCYD